HKRRHRGKTRVFLPLAFAYQRKGIVPAGGHEKFSVWPEKSCVAPPPAKLDGCANRALTQPPGFPRRLSSKRCSCSSFKTRCGNRRAQGERLGKQMATQFRRPTRLFLKT